MSKKQYRPVFSESQILLIKDSFANKVDFESVTIYRYLTKFCRDIEGGYKSGYIKSTQSIEESIGLISSSKESSIDSQMQGMLPADKRKFLYDCWMQGKFLNEDQIKMVQTYRFESDLMSPEEEEEFLK